MNSRMNAKELTRYGIDEWYLRVSAGQEEVSRLDKALENVNGEESQEDINKIKKSRAVLIEELESLYQDEYLNDLWNHPSTLTQSLIADIRAQLISYEKTHPANQPYNVQVALLEIERGVNYIEKTKTNDATERREQYYELVGLLQSVQERNAAIYNEGLNQIIANILEKHRISAAEAKEAYIELCNSNPDTLPVLNKELTARYLHREYAIAREQVRQAFAECYRHGTAEWRTLARSGLAVLVEIENKKLMHQQNKNELFDVKLYTKLLRKTAQVMRQPDNDQLRLEYQQLAACNKSGNASLSSKLAGVVLTVIGAALVVATIVADVASLGVSAPVSLAGKVGGGVMCLLGMGMFANGMRTGIAHATHKFNMDAKKANPPKSPADERTRLIPATR